MDFRSDNTAAAAPDLLAAIAAANEGRASAYGDDDWSRRPDGTFSALFERQVRVFTVNTGTAANAIALASLVPPWGGVICHEEAHIACDECGAPEFFSGGAKLITIGGGEAKIEPDGVKDALARHSRAPHAVKPAAVAISQTSERGAIYAAREIAALAEVAHSAGLRVHVDGARFANAVAALGCSAADLSWRAGVDVMSFGATKNGALGAEAIIAFDDTLTEEIIRRRKRGGHLLSKGRYAAAQLLAYVEQGRWLSWAQRANALAARIGAAAGRFLSAPVQSNQVFINPGVEVLAQLRAGGAVFYDWGADGSGEARLVVSWDQDETDVDAVCALIARVGAA